MPAVMAGERLGSDGDPMAPIEWATYLAPYAGESRPPEAAVRAGADINPRMLSASSSPTDPAQFFPW